MKLLSSLRSRIFLASALLTMLAIGVAVYLVNVRVSEEAERTLQRELMSTSAFVDQLRTARTENFAQMARLIADAPKVKAAVDTNDPPTVQDIANGYQTRLESNLLFVTNKSGDPLATVGATGRSGLVAASQPAVRSALAGRESFSLLPQPDGVLQLMTVPIVIGLAQPEVLGTLSVGFLLDNAVAAQLKEVTGSDIAFGLNGQVLAATLPHEDYPALTGQLGATDLPHLRLGDEDYVGLARPLEPADAAGARPVAMILRSRTEQLRFLQAIHIALGATAALAIVVATFLSFVVARTITRPLAAITDAMREVAATGDLTRKIAVRHDSRWEDEDARLLAATFNTLTDSVSQFQRQLSQKERLTSLGRLSTVIAHEVRNPLMIIKAAVHQLRRPAASAAELHEAMTDIDEEVARLNRIVNEVLDFSRPIRFELAPTDLNALCRDSALASEKSTPGSAVGLDLDPALPTVTTDAERLRIALVNMLVNACHAAHGDGGLVTMKTRMLNGRAAITIGDRGAGIAPGDLSHIFDPYFTTKRGGTGLGLPISKNIVEGLGGSVTVSSTIGQGTSVNIDLPIVPPPQ